MLALLAILAAATVATANPTYHTHTVDVATLGNQEKRTLTLGSANNAGQDGALDLSTRNGRKVIQIGSGRGKNVSALSRGQTLAASVKSRDLPLSANPAVKTPGSLNTRFPVR